MILPFARQTPWKEETEFEYRIQTGIKIHTFRLGDRWKPGMFIDFWSENPRTANKNPYPFSIAEGKAAALGTTYRDGKPIRLPMVYATETFYFEFPDEDKFILKIGSLFIDNDLLYDLVALQDGFSEPLDFQRWFRLTAKKKKTKVLTGQVIHWTRHGIYDFENASILK